jgi:flagellar motor switch protein FliG
VASTVDLAALDGAHRAAVVLTQMPDALAEQILHEMSEVEVSKISKAAAELPDLDAEVVERVVRTFVHRVETLASVRQGGLEAARRILTGKYGAVRADEEMSRVLGTTTSDPLASLFNLEVAQIVDFLSGEHPQITAIVLAHLPAELAASVFSSLEESLREDVAYRVATMSTIGGEAFETLVAGLNQQLLTLVTTAAESRIGGVQAVANILNRVERSVERSVLTTIEQENAEIAEAVRVRMFTFDDLIRLDDRTMQKVVRSIIPGVLAIALKDVDGALRELFMRNLSERAAEELLEEIGALGPTRRRDIEGAQMEVVRRVREMEAEGEIVIVRDGDDVVA